MELEPKKSVKERIVIISNEIRVAKAGKNDFMKAEYFKPDDIMRALNPLLEKYRLFANFNMAYLKEIEMYNATLTIEDFDDIEGRNYVFHIPMQELKGAGAAQSAGATQTYAKRYLLMNVFNLSDDKADLDNPKNKPADKVDYEKKLKAVKSLKELQELWLKIPAIEQKNLQSLKDLLKEKFTPNENKN